MLEPRPFVETAGSVRLGHADRELAGQVEVVRLEEAELLARSASQLERGFVLDGDDPRDRTLERGRDAGSVLQEARSVALVEGEGVAVAVAKAGGMAALERDVEDALDVTTGEVGVGTCGGEALRDGGVLSRGDERSEGEQKCGEECATGSRRHDRASPMSMSAG